MLARVWGIKAYRRLVQQYDFRLVKYTGSDVQAAQHPVGIALEGFFCSITRASA